MTTFDLTEAIAAHLDQLDNFAVPVEAERLAAAIADDDFAAWAIEHKRAIVSERMGRYLGAARRRRHIDAPRSKFRSDAERFTDTGDPSVFDAATYVIDDTDTRKRLGDLVGVDCAYVAASYEDSAQAAALEGAVMRALAKKVGSKRVRDVLTEDQYEALRASLAKRSSRAA